VLASVTSKQTPQAVTDNYLGTDDNGNDEAIDTTAVQDVIGANNAWVAQATGNPNSAGSLDGYLSTDKSSTAANDFATKANGAQVAFHTMAIGPVEASTNGASIYIFTREQYTLAANGQLTQVDNYFVYRLSKSNGQLAIASMTELPQTPTTTTQNE
jgi:hypothetical protein